MTPTTPVAKYCLVWTNVLSKDLFRCKITCLITLFRLCGKGVIIKAGTSSHTHTHTYTHECVYIQVRVIYFITSPLDNLYFP